MEGKGVIAKIYGFLDVLYRLLYLNLLWVCFTILGGIIFGWAPSTIALYSTMRKWFKGELGNDKHILKQYFQTYKQAFLKGNILGIGIVFLGYMLLVNYRYFSVSSEMLSPVISALTIILLFLYVCMLIYIFPLYVHYDLKLPQYFQKTILVAIANPLPTIFTLVWCAIIGFVFFSIPGLIPFVGVSAIAYGLMGITYSFFMKNEEKLVEKQKEMSMNAQR